MKATRMSELSNEESVKYYCSDRHLKLEIAYRCLLKAYGFSDEVVDSIVEGVTKRK